MVHERHIGLALVFGALVALDPMAGGLALADTFQVTKTTDTRDGACDSDCSLREAIIDANQHPGPDTVIVPLGSYVLRQLGDDNEARVGDLDILGDVTITGAGAGSTRIDGDQTDRVFEIHDAAVVQMSGLTLQNGRRDRGGGIYNSGALTLTNSMLSGNSAGNLGGGISNSGSLTLTNTTLSGNSAASSGGGISNDDGATATLMDCMLSGNSALGGGAIFDRGTLTLTRTTLSGNHATGTGAGGGIYFFTTGTAAVTLEGCTLTDNSAGRGGGIYSEGGGTLTVTNTTLSGNSATHGGGIRISGGILTLTNATLSGNSATGSDGGGIWTSRAMATLTGSTLRGNDSAGRGGGIYNQGSVRANLILTDCTLSNNSAGAAAGNGGGIYNGDGGTATLTNTTLSGNDRGQISNSPDGSGSTATLTNTIIANTPQGRSCAGSVQSGGHNLDDDGGCGFFNTGDLSIVPAHLAPLGHYGGVTQTHALCTGPGMPHSDCAAASPAIDAGDNAHCSAIDQRGALRPYGSACDIGAYEAQPNFIPTATTTPTSFPTATPTVTTIPANTASATPTERRSCVGDCGGGAGVTVNELITMVNIALGSADVSTCTAGDVNHDSKITVNELVSAVNAALSGCGR